jgi:hypothetical protein
VYASSTPCSPGSYAGFSGMAGCSRCAMGFYQSMSGQTTCLTCPNGTTTLDTGATNSSQCCTSIGSRACSCSMRIGEWREWLSGFLLPSSLSPCWLHPRPFPGHILPSVLCVRLDTPTCAAGEYKSGETCLACALGFYSKMPDSLNW